MDIIDYFDRKDNSDINKQNLNNILHNCGLNLTEEQMNIITSDHDNIMVNGVPGSAKTTTLVLRQACKITQKQKIQNTIFLTQVSNVTEELVNRLQKIIPDIKFKYSSTSRVVTEYNGHSLEFSNYDGFIDNQLRQYLKDPKNPDYLEWQVNGKIRQQRKWDSKFGKAYEKKRDIFNYLAKNNKLTLKLKNGKLIDKVILDEVQDFSQTVAMVFRSIINNNKIAFEGYGDVLQSIWYEYCKNEEENEVSPYPINIFKTIKDVKLFSLTKSFRLPWWHCEFLRIISKSANENYNRTPIEAFKEKPTKNNDLHKPMYFMHGKLRSNEDATDSAEQIYKIISTIWDNDKDITYGDTTIIAPSINNNAIFNKLESILKKKNIPVEFFRTQDGETSVTIDMNLLKEKTCSNCGKKFVKKSTNCKDCGTVRKRNKVALISGHGFKGGESKLIVAFGLSEKALPWENHPNTPNELRDISLMEVLNSRSQKYLFIGSNFSPTRYITNYMFQLSNVLYLVQDFNKYFRDEISKANKSDKSDNSKFAEKIKQLQKFYNKGEIEKIRKISSLSKENKLENKHLIFLKNIAINDIEKPEIYKKVTQKLIKCNKHNKSFNNPLPKLLIKNKSTLKTPDKNLFSVTDITEKINQYKNIDYIFEDCIKEDTETFGEPCSIEYSNITAPQILGSLPNIKLSIHQDDEFSKCLKRIICNENIIYINEDRYPRIIDILKDNFLFYHFLEGMSCSQISNAINTRPDYKTIDGELENHYADVLLELKNEVPHFRNKDPIEKYIILPDYFSQVFYDTELDTNTKIWNKCLLHDYMYSTEYIQCHFKINNDTEYFTGDLTNALRNIDFVIYNERGIKIEVACNEYTMVAKNEEILKELLFDPIKHYSIFDRGYPCSINGRIDGYIDQHLYEFKMSNDKSCKKSWKLQVLLYSDMGIEEKLDKKLIDLGVCIVPKKIYFKDATLYNFITGEKYTFKIALDLFKEKYKYIFYTEVLDSFNYIPCLKNKFLNAITRN